MKMYFSVYALCVQGLGDGGLMVQGVSKKLALAKISFGKYCCWWWEIQYHRFDKSIWNKKYCCKNESNVCHFHKMFTLKLVKLVMSLESYQKWSSTWERSHGYFIPTSPFSRLNNVNSANSPGVINTIQLDLSKRWYWISHHQQQYLPKLISAKGSFFWGTL